MARLVRATHDHHRCRWPRRGGAAGLRAATVFMGVGLGYVPDEVPVKVRLDVHFGDIDGVALSIGYAF